MIDQKPAEFSDTASMAAVLSEVDGVKIDPAEYEQVKAWQKKIDDSRKFDAKKREEMAVDRRYAAKGYIKEWEVSTNLIGAIIEILLSFTYARDPDIDVTIAESVGPSRYRDAREFAKTLEIVVSRQLKNAKLKKAAKKMVRSAMAVGVGWIKVMFQIDRERDPVIQNQINDLQDNLRRLKVLIENQQSGEAADAELQALEIADQIKGLNSKVEVFINRGLVIDFISADDMQVPASVKEVEDYDQSPWLAQRIFMSVEEAQETTGLPAEKLKTATTYSQRSNESAEIDGVSLKPREIGQGFVCFWEVWDRRSNTVYSLIEGVHCYARRPYNPKPAGLRFYPYFMIGFHFNDGDRWPQSDVEQLRGLQDEYCRTRSNFAEHRKRTLPRVLFNAGEIEKGEAEKIATAKTQEMVPVTPTTPNAPLENLFSVMKYPPIDPGLYTTDPIRSDMEKVSGAQDAMQSGVQVAKTATEAEIQQTGFGARVGARRDAIEDMLTDLVKYVAELSLQTLTIDEAQAIAGPEAFWPEGMPLEQIYSMLSVQIRAGSTGKPNTVRDREAWAALMPIIQASITQIAQLRATNNHALADAQLELLRETLDRSGERIDIERFMPAIGPGQMPAEGVSPTNPVAQGLPELPPEEVTQPPTVQ